MICELNLFHGITRVFFMFLRIKPFIVTYKTRSREKTLSENLFSNLKIHFKHSPTVKLFQSFCFAKRKIRKSVSGAIFCSKYCSIGVWLDCAKYQTSDGICCYCWQSIVSTHSFVNFVSLSCLHRFYPEEKYLGEKKN